MSHKLNLIQLNAVLIGKEKGTIASQLGLVINHDVYVPSWLSTLPISDQQNDEKFYITINLLETGCQLAMKMVCNMKNNGLYSQVMC